MNELISEFSRKELTPYFDIIFFKSENEIYAEYSVDLDTNPVYKPISYKAIQGLLKDLQQQNETKGAFAHFDHNFIPQNVVYYSVYGMYPEVAWVVKGDYKPYYQKGKKERMLYYPNILFFMKENQLYLYALKTTNVTPDTMLYRLPFPNIYQDNNLCWGNIKRERVYSESINTIMRNLENVFFSSQFTTELMRNDKKFHAGLFNQKKPFPKKMLKPFKKLKHVLPS